MGGSFSVVRTADGELARIVWQFWVTMEGGLVRIYLDAMREQTRPSRRHRNWVDVRIYERIHGGRHFHGEHLPAEPVPPQDVLEEAIENVRSGIEYKSWETMEAERGRRPIRQRPKTDWRNAPSERNTDGSLPEEGST